MQKVIGVICIVVSVLLFVWGYNISQSVGSQVERVWTGSPPDKSMYLYIGGAVLGLLGLFQVFFSKK